MVKYLLSIFLFLVSISISFAQPGKGSGNANFIGEQVVSLPWNTDDGLVQKQTIEGSYGSSSFTSVSENKVAFLNELENEVTVYSKNEIVLKFNASISPTLGLSFADGKYFVFGINECSIHDSKGAFIKEIQLPTNLKSVRNVIEVNGDVFFVSEHQTSFWYKNNKFIKLDGIPVGNGVFYKSFKLSNNHFEIKRIIEGKVVETLNFKTNKNLSSLKIIGGTSSVLYFDAEFIVQEKPLVSERRIYSMKVTESNLSYINDLVLPNSYFLSTRNDFEFINGSIYYFLTTEEAGSIYKFDIGLSVSGFEFSNKNMSKAYHYNNFTEPFIESNIFNKVYTDSVVAQISRKEIIARAEAFETHIWTATADNIWSGEICDNQQVIAAPYVKVGENRSVPYMWDGFSSIEKFDEGMSNGLAAGNINTTTKIGSMNCAEGVDCSGFVSQAWNTIWKYDTREFYPIVIDYDSWSDLKPGDIANKPGHIRLFHSWNDDGSMNMLEATTRDNICRVVYNSYTVSEMQSRYTPGYLYSVYEETASVKNNEVFNNAIKVFPNPVVDSFRIIVKLEQFEKGLDYEIISSIGKTLKNGIVDDYPINIEGFKTGMYFVRVSSSEFTVVKKIYKK